MTRVAAAPMPCTTRQSEQRGEARRDGSGDGGDDVDDQAGEQAAQRRAEAVRDRSEEQLAATEAQM